MVIASIAFVLSIPLNMSMTTFDNFSKIITVAVIILGIVYGGIG